MNETTLETVQQLIKIPSTADNPAALGEALGVIETMLAAHENITVEKFVSNGKPSLLAYRGDTRPAKFRVILNGHVDVVPARGEQFTPKVKDGKLYGRGASDMKTAAVILSETFCEMVETVGYPLGLQIVTDEEIGGQNGTGYQLRQGVTTDFALAGEFTKQGDICNESRGICWAEVEFTGVAAHSAYLWNGKNAILMAQDFTQKLIEAIPIPTESAWVTTANVAKISTPNVTSNRVPDSAKVGLDIRYVASDKRFATRESATAFLQSLAPDANVNISELESSHFADPQNENLQKLAAAVEKHTGQPATFIQKHGAADIRFYSDLGIPAVVMGLEGEGLHGDGEYVLLDSAARYRDALRTFLTSL